MMAACTRRTHRPAATAAVDVRVALVAAMARGCNRAGRSRTMVARRESHKGHKTCDVGRRSGVEPRASAYQPVRSAGHPHVQASGPVR